MPASTDDTQPPVQFPLADQDVRVIVVYNPFQPDDASFGDITWTEGRPLADYLDGLPAEIAWGVTINGEIVERESWATTVPQARDIVVVAPIPEGGGGGSKSILRLVAMIAIAAFAAWAAPVIAGAMGLGSIGTAVIGGVITGVGGMLVSALLPPPKPKAPEMSGSAQESPSYGIDGPKNTSTEDVPMPLIYGAFRVGGNIVAMNTVNVDDTQFLTMMSVVGEGPIESIYDVEINGQPAVNYEGVETTFRTGERDQAMSEWFASTTRQINKNIKLQHEFWTTHESESEVDQLRVDLVMPQGIGYVADDGKLQERSVRIAIEYAPRGTEAWSPMTPTSEWRAFSGATSPGGSFERGITGLRVTALPTLTEKTSSGSLGDRYWATYSYDMTVEYRPVGGGAWQVLGKASRTITTDSLLPIATIQSRHKHTFEATELASGAYEIRVIGGKVAEQFARTYASPELRGAQRRALRRTFVTPTLAEGYYKIRVRRETPAANDGRTMDDIVLTDVGEVMLEKLNYRHTAYYGVRVKLSDQLNAIPTITALVQGKRVPHYDTKGVYQGNFWTDNPAWITLDILTNRRYGAGLSLERFDMPKFYEWAEWCALRAYKFNGVFDYKTNIWDAVQEVLRVGHAQIIRVGTRYSLAVEKPEAPAMMFGPGNIIEGTFGIEWLPAEDRANEIEVNFYDREDGHRRKIIRVVDQHALMLGRPQKIASITMQGIDNAAQATFEGHFYMAMNRLIHQTVTFDAPIEAIACSVGDAVLVSHDMPQWGYSGRVEPGCTTTTVKLDRPVTMQSGKSYKLLILHSALKRATATVQLVDGRSVMVTGAGSGRVRRLKAGGRDVAVERVIPGVWTELILGNDITLTPGQAVELWDTDVIEERSVTATSGERTTLTVVTAFSQPPATFTHWMFGEVTKTSKPFRIRSISGDGVETRTITAQEYNEQVYLNPENAGLPANLSDLPRTLSHISVDNVREEIISPDGMVIRVYFEWQRPAFGVYGGADVYISINGEPFLQHATVAGQVASIETGPGAQIAVKLVAFDDKGTRVAFMGAPVFNYTVVGLIDPPGAPTGLVATPTIRGVNLTWGNPADEDLSHIEVWLSESPEQSAAYRIANAYGFTYAVTGLRGVTDYWFWVRAVNKRGVAGPFNGTMGTHARTEPMGAQDIADAIIDGSKLIPELAKRIEMIDLDAINERVEEAVNAIGRPDYEALSEGLLNALTTGYEHFEEIKANQGEQERDFAAVDTKVTELKTADGNLAQQITTVTAVVGDNLALVQESLDAQASELAAQAQRVMLLQAQVDEDITAAIDTVERAMATADEALATRIDSVGALVENNAAAIRTEQKARADGDSALATQITTLAAKVDGNSAAISTEQKARADGDTALSSQITTLTSKVNSNTSAIQNEVTTRANADSALSSSISTLQTTVNGHSTSIQTQANSINGLEAQYTVKIDNNGYVSGFGLASTQRNGTPVSEFIVRADKFAVIHPGYPRAVPFGVYDGKVTMDAAYIRDLSVDTIKIRNGAISNFAGAIGSGAATCYLATEGGRVFINASAYGIIRGGLTGEAAIQGTVEFAIFINGTNFTGWQRLISGWLDGGTTMEACGAISHIVDVGAGTFTIEVRRQGSGSLGRVSLWAQVIKR